MTFCLTLLFSLLTSSLFFGCSSSAFSSFTFSSNFLYFSSSCWPASFLYLLGPHRICDRVFFCVIFAVELMLLVVQCGDIMTQRHTRPNRRFPAVTTVIMCLILTPQMLRGLTGKEIPNHFEMLMLFVMNLIPCSQEMGWGGGLQQNIEMTSTGKDDLELAQSNDISHSVV